MSPEEASEIVFELVKDDSNGICGRQRCMDLAEETCQNTLLSLLKTEFKGQCKLSTYTNICVTREFWKLVYRNKRYIYDEIDGSYVDPKTTNIEARILNETLLKDPKLAHVLNSGPAMETMIVTAIRKIIDETDKPKNKRSGNRENLPEDGLGKRIKQKDAAGPDEAGFDDQSKQRTYVVKKISHRVIKVRVVESFRLAGIMVTEYQVGQALKKLQGRLESWQPC
jgi:hypothetical protein